MNHKLHGEMKTRLLNDYTRLRTIQNMELSALLSEHIYTRINVYVTNQFCPAPVAQFQKIVHCFPLKIGHHRWGRRACFLLSCPPHRCTSDRACSRSRRSWTVPNTRRRSSRARRFPSSCRDQSECACIN